jgi:hypothetical protein
MAERDPSILNKIDDKVNNPYLFPVAEIARCFEDASPIKNHFEYNPLYDFEHMLSCISSDLYSDALESHKNRP